MINGNGWVDISSLYNELKLNEFYFVANNGKVVEYNDEGYVASSDSSNTSTVNMSENIVKNDHGGYKLNINFNREVEKMLKDIEKKNFKMDKYLSQKNQKQYLKNFLKAAIVTQYPDLRSAEEIAKGEKIEEGEIQGCVRVKRYADGETKAFAGNKLSNNKDSDDDGIYLSYMPYEDLAKLINDSDISALNYFSLDSQNNLVIAGWETLDVSMSISQTGGDADPNPDSAPDSRNKEYTKLTMKNTNYISQVSNYSMPFSLLWSLLVYGNDQDFVNDVANLVIDTKIIIGSYDTTNTKVTTYTNTYDKHYTTEDQVYLNDNSTGDTKTKDQVCSYTVTETDTLKTSTPSMKLKYADTWTAIYNNKYKVKTEEKDDGDGDTANLDDETVSQDYKQVTEEDDINKRLEKNEKAKEYVEQEKQKLKEKTHEENQNFKYRYDEINKEIDNQFKEAKCYKLLKEEDVQNFIINLVIEKHSENYINQNDPEKNFYNSFINNQIVIDYAKNLYSSDYKKQIENAFDCVQTILINANEENKSSATDTLYNRLTKNGQRTEKNKTYEAKITSIQYQDILTKKNQKENIKTNTSTSKVEEVTSDNGNITWKVNKNAKTDNFVKLMYHSKKAKANLKIIDSWFFESMEETAAISDLVDLMKFLFQKVYNSDYGISEKDVEELTSLFEPGNFQTASDSSNSSNGNYSTDLEGFLFTGEGGDEYIKGDTYIIYDIGDGCLNIGHGVVIGNSDGTPWYPELIPDPHVGQEVSKEIYDKVVDLKMKQFTDALDASLAKYGVTLKQNQYDAMISFLYNTGSGNSDIIVSAYKNGGNEGFWNEIKQYINPSQYREGLMNRREEEYELFIKGDYNFNPNYSTHKYY